MGPVENLMVEDIPLDDQSPKAHTKSGVFTAPEPSEINLVEIA